MTYRSGITPLNESALDPSGLASLLIDLDFGRRDLVFSDVAGTTKAVLGGEIGCIRDAVSGLSFVKSTTGPTLATTLKGWADFGDATTYKGLSCSLAANSPFRETLEARSPRNLTVLAVYMMTDLDFQTAQQTIVQFRSDSPTSGETWKLSGEYPNPARLRARTYRAAAASVAAESGAYATYLPANQWGVAGFTFSTKDSAGNNYLQLWMEGHRLHFIKNASDFIQDAGSVFTLYVGASSSGNRLKGGIRRLMFFAEMLESDMQRRIRKFVLEQMGVLT